MAELYSGIKFNYNEIKRIIPSHKNLNILKNWCEVFNDRNFAPPYPGGSSGNLSFRTSTNASSFIITCSHTALSASVKDADFSEVIECIPEKKTVSANGLRAPSSESFMHYLIYKNFKEVQAVFHGHSSEIMKKAKLLGCPETEREFEYGTIEFAQSAAVLIKKNNFVILKNHGFVSVGKSMNEAGDNIISIL